MTVGTADSARELLKTWGLVTAARGSRPVVVAPATRASDASAVTDSSEGSQGEPRKRDPNTAEPGAATPQYWAITLRGPDGRRYPARHVREDIYNPDSSRAHLIAIARIEAPAETDDREGWIGDYELEVREPGMEHSDPVLTFRWQGSQMRGDQRSSPMRSARALDPGGPLAGRGRRCR